MKAWSALRPKTTLPERVRDAQAGYDVTLYFASRARAQLAAASEANAIDPSPAHQKAVENANDADVYMRSQVGLYHRRWAAIAGVHPLDEAFNPR